MYSDFDFESDFEVPSNSRNNIHSSQLSNNDNNIDEKVFSEMFNAYFQENENTYSLLKVQLGLESKDIEAMAKEDFKANILGNKNNQAEVEEINLDLGEDNNVPNEAENDEEVEFDGMDPHTKEVIDIFDNKITDEMAQFVYDKKSKYELNREEVANIVEIYKDQLAYDEKQKEQELYENVLSGLNADGSDRNNNLDNDLIGEDEVEVREVNVNEERNDEEFVYLEEAESNARVEEVVERGNENNEESAYLQAANNSALIEEDNIDDYPEERNNENNEDSIDFNNIPVHENLSDRVQGDWTSLIVRRNIDKNNNKRFNQGNNINYIQ